MFSPKHSPEIKKKKSFPLAFFAKGQNLVACFDKKKTTKKTPNTCEINIRHSDKSLWTSQELNITDDKVYKRKEEQREIHINITCSS